MRSRPLLPVLAAVLAAPLTGPAAAAPDLVVAHGWGYSSEPEEGVYYSRGFCDAVALGVAVQTTLTCWFANAIGTATTSVSVSGPGAAFATVEAVTEDRGLWCWRASAEFLGGGTAYYPGPTRTRAECALL